MTRIIWQRIREQLRLPYLDVDLKHYGIGIEAWIETGFAGPLLFRTRLAGCGHKQKSPAGRGLATS